jgi:hypothetical protein
MTRKIVQTNDPAIARRILIPQGDNGGLWRAENTACCGPPQAILVQIDVNRMMRAQPGSGGASACATPSPVAEFCWAALAGASSAAAIDPSALLTNKSPLCWLSLRSNNPTEHDVSR